MTAILGCFPSDFNEKKLSLRRDEYLFKAEEIADVYSQYVKAKDRVQEVLYLWSTFLLSCLPELWYDMEYSSFLFGQDAFRISRVRTKANGLRLET